MRKTAIARMLALWFGAGLSPKAPGTAGSLAALPIAFTIHVWCGDYALFWFAIIITLVGVWAAQVYVTDTGRQDPKEVVIDEVAGQCLLLSFLYPTITSYLVGFILFRLFDVLKPWPVSLADRHIKGGLGVMMDDILAALYPVVFFLLFEQVSAMLGMPFNSRPLMDFLAGVHVL